LKLTAEEVEKLKKKADECDIANRSRLADLKQLVHIYGKVHIKHVSLKRINKLLLTSMLKSEM